jgi:hypothetical protein
VRKKRNKQTAPAAAPGLSVYRPELSVTNLMRTPEKIENIIISLSRSNEDVMLMPSMWDEN